MSRISAPGAVREYLHQFARTFTAPLTRELKERGLEALKAHLERLYQLEGARFSIKFSPDELILSVDACPAVGHVRKIGLAVSPHFVETTRTVNAAICEGTPFAFDLLEYDPEPAGASSASSEGTMISCTEFIPAYSELFKFLEQKGGQAGGPDFWNYLSDTFLGNLRDLAAAERDPRLLALLEPHAQRGSRRLHHGVGREGGVPDCHAPLPLQRAAPRTPHIEPYRDYCRHCDVLYRRVLEPLGYEYIIDLSETDKARCAVTVRKRRRSCPV